MNIPEEILQGIGVGCVFVYMGRRYKLLKKTTTAVAVIRYYWFDQLFDRIREAIQKF